MQDSVLYAVCNNAGIAGVEDIKELFNVNVRGPKRVTDAFLPLLDQKEGRVVMISSGAASQCVEKCSEERRQFFTDQSVTWAQCEAVVDQAETFFTAEDFTAAGCSGNMGGYGLSKALLNSYTIACAREHPHLSVNACSPGMINTDLVQNFAPRWFPASVTSWLAWLVVGAKSPDEGTVAPMHLLFGDIPEAHGWYFGSDAKRSPLDKYRAPGTPPYEPSDLDGSLKPAEKSKL